MVCRLLDGGSILATYDAGSGARLALYNQNPQKIDEVFTYKNALSEKYYPHTDMLGSVYAVSDSTGTSQASWTYDVYGTRTQTSGTLSYAFGFTGREHDVDTGLVYSRQRYYDPSVGSWLSPDRKKMVNGPNLYGYVNQRPTLMTDPFGLAPTYDQLQDELWQLSLIYLDYLISTGQTYTSSVLQNIIGTAQAATGSPMTAPACVNYAEDVTNAINTAGFDGIIATFNYVGVLGIGDATVDVDVLYEEDGVSYSYQFTLYPFIALIIPPSMSGF